LFKANAAQNNGERKRRGDERRRFAFLDGETEKRRCLKRMRRKITSSGSGAATSGVVSRFLTAKRGNVVV